MEEKQATDLPHCTWTCYILKCTFAQVTYVTRFVILIIVWFWWSSILCRAETDVYCIEDLHICPSLRIVLIIELTALLHHLVTSLLPVSIVLLWGRDYRTCLCIAWHCLCLIFFGFTWRTRLYVFGKCFCLTLWLEYKLRKVPWKYLRLKFCKWNSEVEDLQFITGLKCCNILVKLSFLAISYRFVMLRYSWHCFKQ